LLDTPLRRCRHSAALMLMPLMLTARSFADAQRH
jgi:hypothetical protein